MLAMWVAAAIVAFVGMAAVAVATRPADPKEPVFKIFDDKAKYSSAKDLVQPGDIVVVGKAGAVTQELEQTPAAEGSEFEKDSQKVAVSITLNFVQEFEVTDAGGGTSKLVGQTISVVMEGLNPSNEAVKNDDVEWADDRPPGGPLAEGEEFLLVLSDLSEGSAYEGMFGVVGGSEGAFLIADGQVTGSSLEDVQGLGRADALEYLGGLATKE